MKTRGSPQARSGREGIHDWVRREASRELDRIRNGLGAGTGRSERNRINR